LIGQQLEWQLPEIVDDDGDEVVDIIISPSLAWVTFDMQTRKINVDAS
jgi:hypothetical protein